MYDSGAFSVIHWKFSSVEHFQCYRTFSVLPPSRCMTESHMTESLKMLHCCTENAPNRKTLGHPEMRNSPRWDPPNRETHIPWYKFKLDQFSIWICAARYWGFWVSRFGGSRMWICMMDSTENTTPLIPLKTLHQSVIHMNISKVYRFVCFVYMCTRMNISQEYVFVHLCIHVQLYIYRDLFAHIHESTCRQGGEDS